jgi:hypothetical protein
MSNLILEYEKLHNLVYHPMWFPYHVYTEANHTIPTHITHSSTLKNPIYIAHTKS